MPSLLFITSTRIGDAVLSTGLLDHRLRTTPGLRVTVACGPLVADLFGATPGVERVIALTKGPRARHWRHLWAEVVGTRWDEVIDLRNSVVSRAIGARRRTIYRGDGGTATTHKVVQFGRLLGLDPPPAPVVPVSPDDQDRAAALVPPGPVVIALAPVANWHAKTWPADRFVALIDRLTEGADALVPGARIAVLGGPGDRPAAQPVLEAIPPDRCLDLVGGVGLRVIQACLARCALFIGNDSGLMHMAAAAGCPTLGLFGPTPEAVYGPWGRHCAVARPPEPAAVLFPPGADPTTLPCAMLGLSVAAAEAATRALWQRIATPSDTGDGLSPSGTRGGASTLCPEG